MADRFEEMAREIHEQVAAQNWKNGGVLKLDVPEAIDLIAAFGRAQHKAGQEAMREKAAEAAWPSDSGAPARIRALPIEDTP